MYILQILSMNKTTTSLALAAALLTLPAMAAAAPEASLASIHQATAAQSLSAGRGWKQMLSHPSVSQQRLIEPQHQAKSSNFNFIEGPDGSTWYYTQDVQWASPEETGYTYTFASTHIQVFDSHHQLQGVCDVEVPAGMVINSIEPYGRITKKLFDLNASTLEMTISLHEVTPDYTGRTYVWVYQLNGGKVQEFEGMGMIVDASTNDWTTYQRFILSHDNDSIPNLTDIDFYRPASWGEEGPQLEHTLSIESLLINYMDAPFFNFFNDGGKPYYVLAHYEKSYDVRDEEGNMIIDPETYMPEFTEDNSFIIETYDRYFKEVSHIVIPTTAPDWAAIRMMGIGAFSDLDINRGLFTQDGQLNYIVMFEDATLQFETMTTYAIYNQQGDSIAILADSVGDFWNILTPIRGVEEQMLFMTVNNEAYMVDVPSLHRTPVPTSINGQLGSVNIDRYACADDPKGYRYVMALNEAVTDQTQTNVISRYVHLSSDFKHLRNVDINMGPWAVNFTPLVNEQSLNPYLFNTDDLREYIFLTKIYDEPGSPMLHNVLMIANDRGEIIESFNVEGNDPDGDIYSVSLLNYGTTEQQLFVCYYDWDNDVCTMRYFDLPFTSFTAGGEGTAENPYLISSVGDLQQMARNTNAYYRLATDIDAYGHTAAIEEFGGELDGAGHTISNLDVTSTHYYGGLLGAASDAFVHDITFNHPTAVITSKNENFGLLSGYATASRFSDVVVSDLQVVSESSATPVGGLVGNAMAGTTVTSCLVDGSSIQGNSTVGGLVGEMRTGSLVSASAVLNTTISGNNEVGGAVGGIGMGSGVRDCYVADTKVKGNSRLGGIAGYSNGTKIDDNGGHGSIARNVVSNTVVAETAERHYALAAIVGYLEPQWSNPEIVVSDNVAIDSYIALSDGALDAEQMASVHAIAGYSKDNEEPDRPGQVLKEEGLRDNFVYVTPETVANSQAYFGGGDDANTTEGKRVSAEEIAPQSFWTSLGYVFGQSAAAPWAYTEGQTPVLYIVADYHKPSSLPVLSRDEIAPADGPLYNLYGQPASAAASGLLLQPGRKVYRMAR